MLLLTLAGAALRGDVALRQVAVDMVFDALFVVLFIAFYPRGRRRSGDGGDAKGEARSLGT